MADPHAGRDGEVGEQSPTFAAAIRYVEFYGFSVIPLKPGSKVPALASWKEYQDRKPTLDELERWFSGTDNNVGIVTGKISGIIVVDVDGLEGEESIRALRIPRTPTSKTPHGRHIFLAHPGPPVPNRAHVESGVDIRADGGFVVAPPSRAPDGAYAFMPSLGLDDATPGQIGPLPKAWLNGARVAVEPKLPGAIYDGQERWRHLLSLAGTLRNRGLGEAETVEQLAVFNRNRCRPPKPDADLRRIAAWVVERDTTTGLRERPAAESSWGRVDLEGVLDGTLTQGPRASSRDPTASRCCTGGSVTCSPASPSPGRAGSRCAHARAGSRSKTPCSTSTSRTPPRRP